MTPEARHAILSWWQDNPSANSRDVADHFNGDGDGRADLPPDTPTIKPGTVRVWRQRYGEEYGLSTERKPAKRKRATQKTDNRDAQPPPAVPGPLAGRTSCKMHDVITVQEGDEVRTIRRDHRVLELVRLGCTYEVASRAAGISRATLHRWRQKGEEERERGTDGPYSLFLDQIDQAEAEGEARLVSHVVAAAPTDWRAAIQVLERRHPERWRAQKTVEQVQVGPPPGSAPVEVIHTIAQMTPEQIRAAHGVDLDELGKPPKPAALAKETTKP